MLFFPAIPEADGTFSDQSLQHNHVDYIIKKNFTCRGDEETLLNCTYYNRNLSYYGVQCVIMDGPPMMPTQCVDNWDI